MDPQMIDLVSQLLSKLVSSDNEVRKGGEDELEKHWLVNQPGVLLVCLAALSSQHQDAYLRSLAAVLLRRYSLKQGQDQKTLLEQTGAEVLGQIQSLLIQSLNSEQDNSVRNKVADTTSQISTFLLVKNIQWPELFITCGEFISSENPVFRKTAFLIFSGCASLLTSQDQNLAKSMFVAGLQDQDVDVRLASLKATVNYLSASKTSIRNAMADLLPLVLNVIPPVLSDSDRESDASDALTNLIDLAVIHPKLFKPVLPLIVEFMISQMKNTSLEDGTRQSCLELMISLCEGAPGMMRKYKVFAPTIIPAVLEWMTELEDDSDWYTRETIEDDDEATNETAGEQSMDRIAIYLGGEIVLPIAFSLIPSMLSSAEWQKRHAALRCISAIGEGCLKIMKPELEKIVMLILPHMRDPHPRVRHAACNSIGQMCTDFAPKIQETYHEAILSNLIPIMDDVQNIRLANYAAAALVNFSESASTECLAPYIDTIISKLLTLMNTGKIFVQEQAITTLATVADSAGSGFVQYYAKVMPVLLQILQIPNQKEVQNLKVGKEVFASDASAFIEVLRNIQVSVVTNDDPQSSYLLSAWARLCKVMGADFAPYLDIVLPPLFKTVEMKPEMVAFDKEETISDEYTEEEGWEIMAVGHKNLAIKTSTLEDKCTAVEMLLCYAQEMGAIFHPYVEQIMAMVVPMLKFYLNDGVRYAAASVIPVLLQCWIKADYPMEKISQLWHAVVVKILEACEEEEDIAVTCTLYNTLCEGIKAMGSSALTAEHMKQLTIEIMGQLEQYMIRSLERQKSREDDDYEPEDEDALQDEEFSDDQFLADVSSLISTIFKTFGTSFLPFFDELLSKFTEFLQSSDVSSIQWSLCIFCDLVEFTGQASVPYQANFLQIMGESLNNSSSDVRQSAAYGIGVSAKFGGPSYTQFCVAALPHLFNMINESSSRSEENLMATENAIAAIGKIIRVYQDSGLFDSPSIIGQWMACLPIIEDSEEAPEVYQLLIDLIKNNNPAVCSPAQSPKLIGILSQLLSLPHLLPKNPEVLQQGLECLRLVVSHCDAAQKQQLWATLSQEQRSILSTNGLT